MQVKVLFISGQIYNTKTVKIRLIVFQNSYKRVKWKEKHLSDQIYLTNSTFCDFFENSIRSSLKTPDSDICQQISTKNQGTIKLRCDHLAAI